MPELPEVETIRRQLEVVLIGMTIREVVIMREKSFQGESVALVGKKISLIYRRAKLIIFVFDGCSKVMIIHLKMTGQLIYVDGNKRLVGGHPSVDWISDLPSKHSRVVLVFEDGSKLFFNDLRVFGWIKVMDSIDFDKLISRLPLDVVDDGFDLGYFARIVGSSRKAIKRVLMDQSKIGGVGNIYANDALFIAKVDPRRISNSLKTDEIRRLFEGLKLVINEGINLGGATAADKKYINLEGLGGRYQENFRVYERKGEKCLVCGGVIEKITLAGRGTYFCPKCQK